jgi:hypothetical protein
VLRGHGQGRLPGTGEAWRHVDAGANEVLAQQLLRGVLFLCQ